MCPEDTNAQTFQSLLQNQKFSDGWTDRLTAGQMDGQTDRQPAGQMDGQTDGRPDR